MLGHCVISGVGLMPKPDRKVRSGEGWGKVLWGVGQDEMMGVDLGSHCSSINLAEKLMCLHFKALVMGRYFLPSDVAQRMRRWAKDGRL